MAKWLDKYENGGEYLGTTNKGFNYNGAWGGPSMQMGGNIQPPMAGADQTVPMYQMGGYVYPTTFVPQAQKGREIKYIPPPPMDYELQYSGDESKKYPVSSDVMKQIVSTSVGMNYDPKRALAVALQESGIGRTDPNYFHVLTGKTKSGKDRIPKEYQNLTMDELGIQLLKDKQKLANKLGYTTPEMELQTYNGLGRVFRDTEKDYHGFEMQKIYGVPIPEEGIDMEKNPLYGKRIMELEKEVINKDPYVNQLVDYYNKFYSNPDSVYYTKASELEPIEIVAPKANKNPSKSKKQSIVDELKDGGSVPGSVGFTYARTQGIPSEGPYGKKTVPSAQKGKKQEPSSLDLAKIKSRMALESHFGNPSARRMTTLHPQDLPFKMDGGDDEGKIGTGTHWMATMGNYAVPIIQEDTNGKLFFKKNASPRDRESMRFETPEEALMFAENYKEVAPMSRKKYVNGGEMEFYQNGLDWTPRNISEYGSEIPMAQPGITQPMRGDIQTRGNQNLLTEIAAQRTKEKKAQEARTKTTIGADKRTAKQKEKDRQYAEQINKRRKEMGLPEGTGYLTDRKKADKILSNIMTPLEAASYVTGIGSIGSNFLRLGASALEKQIGKNLVSKGLKNATSYVNPIVNKADEALAYAQLDPIGIMGNSLNSKLYNPTTSINRVNNTITGVDRNLKNSLVEASDIVAGTNNTENITRQIITPNFKSEIDWGKWNPETPNYPELINEYNAIEESTKKAGTWMKNPDGSSFQGTPEQFIQQQSSYFKKAFGDSKLVNPDGSPTIQYHGSAKKFDIFDESKFQLGDAGYSGRGIYTTPSKAKAESYALSSKSIHKNGNYEPTVYELYGRGNNPISAEDLIKQKKEYDLFNFHRQKDWRGDVPLEEQLLDYDVAIRNQTRGIERVSPWYQADELVFPTNKQLKSAVGNVGFFDMTNPNIYKAVVPAAIGTTALGAIEQKKKGGVVKDNDGYWNPDNHGKIVEIDSPNITMKGVNQDLIGVSDEGDVQYMTPGNDYKFKGKKVKEYPVGKYGVNQQDEKTVQHLDQLLNFTNKPKAKNGWLDKYK